VELEEAVRRRKMVRRYSNRPVPAEILDRLLGLAVRAPSAGFSQGVDLLVLEGPAQTRRFFEATCDPEFLDEPQAKDGILRAPVIVLPLGDPGIYVSRYAEQDKNESSLAGLSPEEWPVPYWLVDSAFVVMLLLLAATEQGLGALFFRLHRDPGPLLSALGVPDGKEVIGAVALGYEAAGDPNRSPAEEPSPSPRSRPRRSRRPVGDVVHRGSW